MTLSHPRPLLRRENWTRKRMNELLGRGMWSRCLSELDAGLRAAGFWAGMEMG